MIIEINKDIDRYKESVVMGLTARQLIYSIVSIIVGGSIVLLLYKHIGLTASAYVAIPAVTPIALGGFYSFNGMNFYQYMGRRLHFMFGNKPLTYISTEGSRQLEKMKSKEKNQKGKKKNVTTQDVSGSGETNKQNNNGKYEDFETMKNKMKKVLMATGIGLVFAIIAAIVAKKFI